MNRERIALILAHQVEPAYETLHATGSWADTIAAHPIAGRILRHMVLRQALFYHNHTNAPEVAVTPPSTTMMTLAHVIYWAIATLLLAVINQAAGSWKHGLLALGLFFVWGMIWGWIIELVRWRAAYEIFRDTRRQSTDAQTLVRRPEQGV